MGERPASGAEAHMTDAMRSGPRTYYPGKAAGKPRSILLTEQAHAILDHIRTRTGASRSDIIEFLIRHYGDRVQFIQGGD